MGNKTTVTTMSLGGALATFVIWLSSYYAPELAAVAPAGAEAALTVILSGIVGWISRAK